ncbi:MAG: thiamine diphosphokinase [Firmicutes bacterium]|jgi:thiamine pyrophosphokinase|nr:thiamine diphosphokinase [Bacillota bacterium]
MRTLILLAGELCIDAWGVLPELSGPWDCIICADGGAYHALRLGIVPDVVMGDFDSLAQDDIEDIGTTTTISFPTAKDKTDAHLAADEALRRGSTEVVLAGAFGGRLDHTLANIGLLRLLHKHGVKAMATDGRQTVYYVTDELILTESPGRIVSVWPLSPEVHGVSLTGLRWPLERARLELGDTRTISNEFVGGPAKIALEVGELLVIVNRFPPHECHGDATRLP